MSIQLLGRPRKHRVKLILLERVTTDNSYSHSFGSVACSLRERFCFVLSILLSLRVLVLVFLEENFYQHDSTYRRPAAQSWCIPVPVGGRTCESKNMLTCKHSLPPFFGAKFFFLIIYICILRFTYIYIYIFRGHAHKIYTSCILLSIYIRINTNINYTRVTQKAERRLDEVFSSPRPFIVRRRRVLCITSHHLPFFPSSAFFSVQFCLLTAKESL